MRMRFLLALLGVVPTVALAQSEPAAVAREIENACERADTWYRGPQGRALGDLLLACATEPPPAEDDGEGWSWDLTGYFVDPPEDDPYGSAILRADRGVLHLEARYNYEDMDTGSVFAGRTFAWEGAVEFSLVPMVGAVFGRTDGVAPGLELDFIWKALEVYVEAEYVFDFDGADEGFFYMWSELTVSPVEWFAFGLVAQRTRAYETDVEVDRGLLVGFYVGSVSATVYLFNLDRDDPYVMVGVGVTF
jgi:hypothetical protein